MTKKELKSYRHLMGEIRQLDDQMRQWRSRAARITRAPEKKAKSGSRADPLPRIMDKIAKLERVQTKKIAELADIEAALATLDARDSRLMRLYYVDGYYWQDVADIMGYGVDRVLQLHGSALKKIREK